MKYRDLVRGAVWGLIAVDVVFAFVFIVATILGMKDGSHYVAMAMGRAAFHKCIVLDLCT